MSEVAPGALRRQVAAITDVIAPADRRAWSGRNLALLAAAALLAVAVVGTAIIGAGLLKVLLQPSRTPTPAVTMTPTAQPSQSASPEPTTTGAPRSTVGPLGQQIAFVRLVDKPSTPEQRHCLSSEPSCPEPRVWLVGVDGSGAHELFPAGVNYQTVVAWSPDGRYLIFQDGQDTYVTDVAGSRPIRIDTGCVAPCLFDIGPSFSADGRHLVFVRQHNIDYHYSVATMELATGRVLDLTSTSSLREILLPGWSPDGTQIVFWRPGDKFFGGPIAPLNSAIWIVDADGQNLHQVSPVDLPAESPRWSPDGARLVFMSSNADATDIYAMRPDGSDIRRLTTNHVSMAPSWTPEGRILFIQRFGGFGSGLPAVFWVMDADGSHAAELMSGDVTQADGGGLWQPNFSIAIVPPPWIPSAGGPVGPPAPTPVPTLVPDLAAGFNWTGSLASLPFDSGPDTATLLPDGRVLVTIACDRVAQLYDARAGTFTAAASMITERAGASATMLADGRVLIAGGGECSESPGILNSAEIYDPSTGRFSATGVMGARRLNPAATLLQDGRVLIAGGSTDHVPLTGSVVITASYHGGPIEETPGGTTLASAELYDPQTGTFSPTGAMTDFRNDFTATLLRDGRVLVAGGGAEGFGRDSAELYDPATGAFTSTGSMNRARWLHTATLLSDGRVLIAGGRSPNDLTYPSAEIYDPASGRFTVTERMSDSRQGHTATLLPDGRVLIAGGHTQSSNNWNVLASTEIFDPATGQFSSSGSMGQARENALAVRLVDGRVLIAGGTGIGPESLVELSSAVIYQP